MAALAIAAGWLTAPAIADPVTDDQIQQSKNAETQAANGIASLEVQLASLAAQHNDLSLQLAEAQAEQIRANAAVDQAFADFSAAEEAFLAAAADSEDARLKLATVSNEIYREGVGSIASANYLFGASSLAEANDKARAYQMLGLSTDQQLQEYEALKVVADSLQKELDKTVETYTNAKEEADNAAAALAQATTDVETQQNALNSQRDGLIVQLAAQKGTTADLERQQQDQKDAAARAQAEQQRQQILNDATNNSPAPSTPSVPNTNTGNTNSGNTNSGNTNSGGTKPAPNPQPTQAPAPQPTQAPAPKPTPTQAPAPSVPSGGTPSAVSIAEQYIGYRYVWGTNGPNTFDCSGFTQFVYGQLGYSLPHSSSGQRYVGTEIPASEARAGDLVWWPNHVAISLGGGKHIAARNPNSGVGYSEDRYISGTPVYIRLG